MFDVQLFLYQAISVLYSIIIPLAMLLTLIWLLVKMLKMFITSIFNLKK